MTSCLHYHTPAAPKPGDCCVYCSFGSVPCPPVQSGGRAGCCGA
ncbi:MAG: GDCCVxC domain-containing (seleno)protein [Stagnimonas sp.]|nr:GDCCVxC domain-containing (seleno)protein [Stagnimonas sp.]